MSIASTLVTALKVNADLQILVADNISENAIATGPDQFIVFDISETPDTSLDGSTGVTQAAINVQCWAKRSLKAGEIADAVSLQIKNFDGTQADVSATVISRSSTYDVELDMNGVVLTIEWWQQ